MSRSLSISLCLSFFIAACGSSDSDRQEGPKGTTALSYSVLKYADLKDANPNERKRYFLIAGGIDAANFGEEIIEQKKHLLSMGVPEKEIACFYSIPYDKEFKEDEKHYRALAADLSKCYAAFPKNVWTLMEHGGVEQDSIYVYATSHGDEPMSVALAKSKDQKDIDWLKKWLELLPSADQYLLFTGAGKNGEPLWYTPHLEAIKNGEGTVEDFLFTPKHLKAALERATTKTAKKAVIIQACHSGGFITAENSKHEADTLKSLENISVLTAARPDRSSFGCGVGNHRTFFGGAFNDALKLRKSIPRDVQWNQLYEEVANKVKAMEADFQKDLSTEKQKHFKPSEPLFFQR